MIIKLQLILLTVFLFCSKQVSSQFLLQGYVKDEKNGKELSGVTILEKGTTNGTSSDANGRFILELRKDTTFIILSIIGYSNKELEVKKGYSDFIEVKLKDDSEEFDSLLASHAIYPLAVVGLSSGLKYTPLGLTIRNYKPDYSILPVYVNEISYRTDLK